MHFSLQYEVKCVGVKQRFFFVRMLAAFLSIFGHFFNACQWIIGWFDKVQPWGHLPLAALCAASAAPPLAHRAVSSNLAIFCAPGTLPRSSLPQITKYRKASVLLCFIGLRIINHHFLLKSLPSKQFIAWVGLIQKDSTYKELPESLQI